MDHQEKRKSKCYAMKFYSAMRKNRILTFATWMELEGIMLSEIRQADKYCMVLHTCGNGKNNNNNDNIEIVSRKVVASSWNVGETEIGVCVLSRVQTSATPWTVTRLLCPWDFPGKNVGMGCHFFLQEIESMSLASPILASRF